MVIIEECLRHFDDLRILHFGQEVLTDVYLDITHALQAAKFTDLECLILSHVIQGHNFSSIERSCGISRKLVPLYFAQICMKIEDTLGGDYITKLKE